MKKILNNKIITFIFAMLEWIVFFVLLVLIILTGFQKFSNQGNFFGYRIYTVASGSMIPIYNIGDTLLIEEMDASKLNVGDAVTYIGDGGGVEGMIITHQIIKIEKDENGKFLFHTKGVANNIADPIIGEDQVLGKVIHKFFFLSILGRVTTSMPLFYTFVTIPIAILIAIEIIKIVYKKDEDDDEEDEEDDENSEIIDKVLDGVVVDDFDKNEEKIISKKDSDNLEENKEKNDKSENVVEEKNDEVVDNIEDKRENIIEEESVLTDKDENSTVK